MDYHQLKRQFFHLIALIKYCTRTIGKAIVSIFNHSIGIMKHGFKINLGIFIKSWTSCFNNTYDRDDVVGMRRVIFHFSWLDPVNIYTSRKEFKAVSTVSATFPGCHGFVAGWPLPASCRGSEVITEAGLRGGHLRPGGAVAQNVSAERKAWRPLPCSSDPPTYDVRSDGFSSVRDKPPSTITPANCGLFSPFHLLSPSSRMNSFTSKQPLTYILSLRIPLLLGFSYECNCILCMWSRVTDSCTHQGSWLKNS